MVDEFTDGYDPNVGDEFRANDVPIWPLGGKSVTVTYEDTSAVSFGQLPEGAIVLGVVAEVVTSFDDTPGSCQVGIDGNATKFVDGDIGGLGSAGVEGVIGTGSGASEESADATLQAQYTVGGSETQGEVRFTVLWVASNDN